MQPAHDGDPDALNRLGRDVFARGDVALAIAFQRTALRIDPTHERAAADLASSEAAIIDRARAATTFDAAVTREPLITVHHASVGAFERFVGSEQVERLLAEAIRLDPSHARAHAALGNLAARRVDRAGAMAAYARAVMLDWEFADAHLALAQLYDTEGKVDDGDRHLREALARRRLYASHARSAVRRVLVLKLPGRLLANGLIDYIVDANRTDLDVLYVLPDTASLPDLSGYDAVFCAISASASRASEIDHVGALVAASGRRVHNDPRVLSRTLRAILPTTLANVVGCIVPPTQTVVSAELASRVAAMGFPVVARPLDTHRGDGLERLQDADDVAAYLGRVPAAAYDVAPFVDYRSPDGYYRKYRVTVVDGVPFPYHLAISDDWLVHYWRTLDAMRDHAWMRAEEERFLREPQAVFPTWHETFGAIASATGLDYFSVDCTVAPNGNVLMFECDPTAFVHCREALDGPFTYKYAYVPRIFAALDELLDRG